MLNSDKKIMWDTYIFIALQNLLEETDNWKYRVGHVRIDP